VAGVVIEVASFPIGQRDALLQQELVDVDDAAAGKISSNFVALAIGRSRCQQLTTTVLDVEVSSACWPTRMEQHGLSVIVFVGANSNLARRRAVG